MPWSRRLQRNDRLTHTHTHTHSPQSLQNTHTHTHCEEEWQITAAATVHTWTCVSNVKSKTSFNSCVCLFPPSLSLSVSFVLLWNDFQTSLSFASFSSFLAPNSTVSFSIYLLFSSLSLLWFLRWLLPQSFLAFPLSLSLFPLPRSATPSWMAGYYGWRLVRGKSLSLSCEYWDVHYQMSVFLWWNVLISFGWVPTDSGATLAHLRSVMR